MKDESFFDHPLLQVIQSYGDYEEFWDRRQKQKNARIKEIIAEFEADGVDFRKGGQDAVVRLGTLLYEFESAAFLTAAYLKIDLSLKGLDLTAHIHEKLFETAGKRLKQGMAAAKANRGRKASITKETLKCVVAAYHELVMRTGKPPGGQRLATRTKQLMAANDLPKSQRELITRYRASALAKKLSEAYEDQT